MEIYGYIAALAAATCWAVGSIISVGPVRKLGPIAFNTLRMFIVACLLSVYLLISQKWFLPNFSDLKWLLISGLIGIFLGDTLLFTSVKILGPRMAGLLFATNAPLTFLIGLWLLGDSYNFINFFGVVGVTAGIFLAISARASAGKHQWEQSTGHVGFGILAGFGAATCQSLGAVLIVNLLREGLDPVFATTVRVWVAVLFLGVSLLVLNTKQTGHPYRILTLPLFLQIAISGIFGMAIGMSLYLIGISLAPIGIATILSATTPVIVLPILWLTTKERPARLSLIAAMLVVTGTAFIFIAG